MRLVRVALSALGGAILASSAMAADYVAAVPPPPVWGFYFGGGVCYDWADFDIDKTKTKTKSYYHYGELVTVPIFSHTKNYEGDAQAWCGTATIGYDYQIDQLFVVGIFASYDWQKKKGDIFKVDYPQYDKGDVWLGNIATVAGRAGILVQPDLLVYALVGWSWSNGGFELYGKELSGNLNGPTIGAGIEKLFHTNWSARLEYRLTDFGSLSKSHSWDYQCCGKTYTYTKTTTAHITDQSIRLVLTYRP
jgi:outer membrane immunogenic protein